PLAPAAQVKDIAFRHTNCCLRYGSGHADCGDNDMIVIAFNLLFRDTGVGRLGVSVYQSFSQGSVRLTCVRPEADPAVEANLLDDPRDLARLADGVQRLAALLAQPAFQRIAAGAPYFARGRTPLMPLPQGAALDTLLLAEASDAQHATSTCAME